MIHYNITLPCMPRSYNNISEPIYDLLQPSYSSAHFLILDLNTPITFGNDQKFMKLVIVFYSLVSLLPSKVQIFSTNSCIQMLSIYVLPLMWEMRFYIHKKSYLNLQCLYSNHHILRQEMEKQNSLN